MKRILKVCLRNPNDGKKGDARLIVERTRTLEKMSLCVDILYFKIRLFGRSNIDTVKRERREGKEEVRKEEKSQRKIREKLDCL